MGGCSAGEELTERERNTFGHVAGGQWMRWTRAFSAVFPVLIAAWGMKAGHLATAAPSLRRPMGSWIADRLGRVRIMQFTSFWWFSHLFPWTPQTYFC